MNFDDWQDLDLDSFKHDLGSAPPARFNAEGGLVTSIMDVCPPKFEPQWLDDPRRWTPRNVPLSQRIPRNHAPNRPVETRTSTRTANSRDQRRGNTPSVRNSRLVISGGMSTSLSVAVFLAIYLLVCAVALNRVWGATGWERRLESPPHEPSPNEIQARLQRGSYP
jgi:hypothetical protein